MSKIRRRVYKFLEHNRVGIITVYLPIIVKLTHFKDHIFPFPPKPSVREEQTSGREKTVSFILLLLLQIHLEKVGKEKCGVKVVDA